MAIEEEGLWNVVMTRKGVEVSKRFIGYSSVVASRGVGIIDGIGTEGGNCSVTPRLLLKHLLQHENWSEWDTHLLEARFIRGDHFLGPIVARKKREKCLRGSRVVYMLYRATYPLYPRDMVCNQTWREEKSGTIILHTTSIFDPNIPESSATVRANVYNSGFVIEPVFTSSGNAGCRVTFISHINLGGWIPFWLMNLLGNVVPLVVAKLRDSVNSRAIIAASSP